MRWFGLTLVELLVVIAVIALLAAMLAPSLLSSRERARAILCGSNIKQLAQGLIAYETEGGTFPYAFDDTRKAPPSGGWPGNSAYDKMGWWWFNHLVDYSRENPRKDSIIWCPAREVRDPRLKHNALYTNYGVNQSICRNSFDEPSRAEFVGVPLRITDISQPSRALLVVDSGYSTVTWWHATNTPPIHLSNTREDTASYIPGLWVNENRKIWPGQEWDAINGRHPNKTVNAGFVDGHIERTSADDLFVEHTDDGYKNCSPLWFPK